MKKRIFVCALVLVMLVSAVAVGEDEYEYFWLTNSRVNGHFYFKRPKGAPSESPISIADSTVIHSTSEYKESTVDKSLSDAQYHYYGCMYGDGTHGLATYGKCTLTTPEAHTFGNWVTTKRATCTRYGVQARKCTVCDYAETQALPKTGKHYFFTTLHLDGRWFGIPAYIHWEFCPVCGLVTCELYNKDIKSGQEFRRIYCFGGDPESYADIKAGREIGSGQISEILD